MPKHPHHKQVLSLFQRFENRECETWRVWDWWLAWNEVMRQKKCKTLPLLLEWILPRLRSYNRVRARRETRFTTAFSAWAARTTDLVLLASLFTALCWVRVITHVCIYRKLNRFTANTLSLSSSGYVFVFMWDLIYLLQLVTVIKKIHLL